MAGNAGFIGGTLYMKVGGKPLDLLGNWKVNPVSRKLTEKPFQSGGGGFMVENVAVSFEGSIADTGTVSVQTLYGLTNIPVTLELVNGKTYSMKAATFTDSPSIDVMQGETPVKITDFSMLEQVASAA